MVLKKSMLLVVAITLVASAIFYSCSKSSSGSDTDPGNSFDKKGMLTYYADNLIIPGYKQLQTSFASFKVAVDAFLAAPSGATQLAVKTAYREAHLQYERVALYQFGPAGIALLDNFLNFSGGLDYNFNTNGELTGFSIDSVTIESNIANGGYNLATFSRSSCYAQGFPALNYLLFGTNAITKFNTNTANRVKYVNDLMARAKTLIDKVVTDWDAFRPDFIANTQSNVGSPIGNLVNQFAYQMDMIKGPRIGWPFGKQSNGIVFATKTEAYFAGISVELAVENLTALKNAYTAGGSGKGLSDYLIALKKTTLNNDVLAQFDVALTKLKLIPDPLSTSLTTQPAVVDAAYKELQKLLTLLKTDVASATAVQITFMDNDGD
jgi:hypothetical protein